MPLSPGDYVDSQLDQDQDEVYPCKGCGEVSFNGKQIMAELCLSNVPAYRSSKKARLLNLVGYSFHDCALQLSSSQTQATI